MYLGLNADNARDQCINGFASFLSLLESIPFDDAGSNNGSFDNSIPDRRYISFFTWLTLNGHCSQIRSSEQMLQVMHIVDA